MADLSPQLTTAQRKAQLTEAGTPDPLDFRRARPVAEAFMEGAVLSATATAEVYLPIAGALLVRIRGKLTQAGTLNFTYRRSPPNQGTGYTVTPPCADLVVAAGIEFLQDIQPGGESLLRVMWTPDGVNAATVTYLDIMQL